MAERTSGRQKKPFFSRLLQAESLSIALLLLLGTALRLATIGVGFFGDENHTIRAAACFPISDIVSHNWGSLFYTLLVYFLLPLGKWEIVARVPALLFGILGIYAIFAVAKIFLGRREALITAAYLTVSPYHIYYSQFARGYTATIFFSLLSLFFFLRAIRDGALKYLIGYALSSIFLVYAHLAALFFLIVQGIFLGILIIGTQIKRAGFWPVTHKTIIRFTAAAVGIAVVVLLLYLPDIKAGGTENITLKRDLAQKPRPFLEYLKSLGWIIFRAFHYKTQSWAFNPALGMVLVAFFLLGGIVSFTKYFNQVILTFLSITLPPVLFLITRPSASFIRNAPARYFIFFMPFFLFFIAKGVTAFWDFLIHTGTKLLKNRPSSSSVARLTWAGLLLSCSLLAGFLAPQLKTDYQYRRDLPDFRGALGYVNKLIQDDDVVILDGTYLFFFDESNITDGFPFYIDDYYQKEIRLVSKYDIISELGQILDQKRQLWGIISPSKSSTVKMANDQADIKAFRKITVIRFERDILSRSLERLLDICPFLRAEDQEDYHLAIAHLSLFRGDVEKARQQVYVLYPMGSLNLLEEKSRREVRNFFLMRRSRLYMQLSEKLLSQGCLPESFLAFLKFASLQTSEGYTHQVIHNFAKLLNNGIDALGENWLSPQFIDVLPCRAAACFLWQDSWGWHLRWKGRRGAELEGKISSTSAISLLKTYQLSNEDQCRAQEKMIKFNVHSKREQVQGLDFLVGKRSAFTLELLVNARGVPEKIFSGGKEDSGLLLPLEIRPQKRRQVLCFLY